MKSLLSVLIASIFIFGSQTSLATETIARLQFKEETKVEIKKVCVDQKQKDGSTKEVCKTIKVHKKLEGTPVPPAKK